MRIYEISVIVYEKFFNYFRIFFPFPSIAMTPDEYARALELYRHTREFIQKNRQQLIDGTYGSNKPRSSQDHQETNDITLEDKNI